MKNYGNQQKTNVFKIKLNLKDEFLNKYCICFRAIQGCGFVNEGC